MLGYLIAIIRICQVENHDAAKFPTGLKNVAMIKHKGCVLVDSNSENGGFNRLGICA